MSETLPLPAMIPSHTAHLAELPMYVLLFMLFMASSYFTGFFPVHTANLIGREPIARHILGYTILVTTIASLKQNVKTLHIMLYSCIAYAWCYAMSRQGPISFSVSIMFLTFAYLLNKERQFETHGPTVAKIVMYAYYLCIIANILIVVSSMYFEY